MSDEPINSPVSEPSGQTVGTDSVNQEAEIQHIGVAQLVEQRSPKPSVESSSLSPLANSELELLNPNRPIRYRKDGEIDRRAFSSARNGGRSPGHPVMQLDAGKAINAAAQVMTGSSMSQALAVNGLGPHVAQKIQKLIDLTPEEYLNRLGDRLENIVEKLSTRLEAETDKIGTRDLTLQIAILTDKLTGLRGAKPPTSVHNVQVNINGYSRESALAALTGRKAQIVEVIAEKAATG